MTNLQKNIVFQKIFLKLFNDQMKKHAVKDRNISWKRIYHRESTMRGTEVMTIIIFFHVSRYRCLKHCYFRYVCVKSAMRGKDLLLLINTMMI